MRTLRTVAIATASALTLAASVAQAGVFTLDVSGFESWDGLGSPNNDVFPIDLAVELGFAPGTPLIVDALGWDVTIETAGDSWLSEASVAFSGSGADFLGLSPGVGSDFPGTASFSSGGLVDLASLDPDLPVELPDGILVLEFYESFDDVADQIDAFWTDGTLDISANTISVPGALPLGLSAVALAGVFVVRRRRGRQH